VEVLALLVGEVVEELETEDELQSPQYSDEEEEVLLELLALDVLDEVQSSHVVLDEVELLVLDEVELEVVELDVHGSHDAGDAATAPARATATMAAENFIFSVWLFGWVEWI